MSEFQVLFLRSKSRLRHLLKHRFATGAIFVVLSMVMGFLWGVLQPAITHTVEPQRYQSQKDAAWSTQPSNQSIEKIELGSQDTTDHLRQIWAGYLGKSPEIRNDSLTANNWRIAGSSASADGNSLIIVYDGSNVPILIREGDPMPGGGTLVSINDQFASVLMNSKTVYLPMRASQ